MFPFNTKLQAMVSSCRSIGIVVLKKILTFPFTLLASLGKFIVTRPWLSGVAVVCTLLALMVMGYGPVLDSTAERELADEYHYLDEGFRKNDRKAPMKKFETEDSEIAVLIEKRPDINKSYFSKSKRTSPFDLENFDSTPEQNLQPDVYNPAVWSHQVNQTSQTSHTQKPVKVVSKETETARQRTLHLPDNLHLPTSPIFKASASQPAAPVWLLGIIEEETKPDPIVPEKSSKTFAGPLLVPAN